MKNLIIASFILICSCISLGAKGQNFKADLRKMDADIEAAYKRRKLTEVEYGKLKHEHNQIRVAIEKAMVDDYFSPDEKNKIHSKIIKSKKRFAKYKTNREIY